MSAPEQRDNPIIDDVQLYLDQMRRVDELLDQRRAEDGYTDTLEGRKTNYWRGFVVGTVSTATDLRDREYLAVYPINPTELSVEFNLDSQTRVRVERMHPEVVYDDQSPGQLQGQPRPERWDILLAKRVGTEMGSRASLQIIKARLQK